MASEIDVLREVTNAAAEIFTAEPRQKAAVSYLRHRGIDAAGLSRLWLVGYAPPGRTRLVDKLSDRFPEQALLEAGVARISSGGTLIDTFRDRVMFGIRQPDGQVAGFIGRDLSGRPGAPKYLNTRQSPLFDKGALLYGLHEGLQDRRARQPVVVEGVLDVLAIVARQTGNQQADLLPVAVCGTAFTETHAAHVVSVAVEHRSPAVVAMDGDAAGCAAAVTAGERLRGFGLDVRVAMLPTGSDPAEYLARAGSSLDTFRAEHALPLIHVQVQDAISRQDDRMQWVEGRLAALRSVTGYLASYPPTYAAHQVGWLAEALRLAPSTVTAELAEAYVASGRDAVRRARTLEVGAHLGL